ncbi:MAG: hypothetical protein U0R52_13885 [Solirubrobacterales bacterium]
MSGAVREGAVEPLGPPAVRAEAGVGQDRGPRHARLRRRRQGRGVREDWVVEDRWWTPRPLRRRYLEVVLEDGRDVVLFRSRAGAWFLQRG